MHEANEPNPIAFHRYMVWLIGLVCLGRRRHVVGTVFGLTVVRFGRLLVLVAAKDAIKIVAVFGIATPSTFGRLEGNAVVVYEGWEDGWLEKRQITGRRKQ